MASSNFTFNDFCLPSPLHPDLKPFKTRTCPIWTSVIKMLQNVSLDFPVKVFLTTFKVLEFVSYDLNYSVLDPSIARASLHPPHLTDTKGLPAFIPFCAYGGNMKVMGEYIEGLNFPVCNKFKPQMKISLVGRSSIHHPCWYWTVLLCILLSI